MKRLFVGVAAAFMLMTGQAAAEGLAPPSRIAAPGPIGPNWNGFYVGAGIGAGAVVHDYTVDCYYCGHARSETTDFGGEGVFGTVTVGYDRVIRPGWVAGAFADYDFGSTISTEISGDSIDHNHSWSVGGRLGFLSSPSTLIYGTAGYTQAEFDFGATSKTFDGYFVGAGIETFLRQNWTLKLEYRFSQFDEQTIFDTRYCDEFDEASMHTARLVLSYKFGHRA
ncbi:MAG: outer membrane protein, partial [Microvirga sp.]